ncbi:HD-GYP domain-containing protein [Agrilutibacter solisilvae]|uniref:HAMP domain-containing protein n=1 Tax=Agrilutibacter solisilvae TaxID=2763317 RepID=A0A974XYM5_9GAMM|nr:HD domain-containing phosphohydrolase [Lysobacter solisilvae]QSX78216.1 HAMP domain-containing protein [Lysobacter solisilvae]
MAARPILPLYLHITALSLGLVLALGGTMRWVAARYETPSVFLALFGVAILIALAIAHWLTRPLRQLADEAEAVRRFDFSDRAVLRSSVTEINELAQSVDLMRDALRRFLELNLALAGEEDFEALLPRVLTEMAGAGAAHAGVLYLVNARGDALVPGALRAAEVSTARPGIPDVPFDTAPALLGTALRLQRPAVGALSARELLATGLDPAMADQAAVALPLLNRHDALVGALLLFGERALEPMRLSFLTAVSAGAALSLETRELVRGQKDLLEAIIRMIAGAIDAQSPYTGGHCERVPELTFMLARAACATREGPFADFDLDARQWEAVHIASWLHDCGKVTTPEYVVDKATKLETICDRIHEVRMRFEVLKRDAHVDFWRAVAQGGDEAALRRERDARCMQLDEEFAFVARCNVGGEYLPPEQQERLRRIGAQTWLRTLDDRLGLSRDELSRRTDAPAPLPVDEPLLADKPEHRIARPPGEGVAAENPWGFRMEVPELLYNRGELHNLTVSRGTLSSEERYKINEHIVQTIVMLSQLPFPRHLRNVPEIAGGHHEKMDGTGYPKGLTREQMSPVARMMAIADIFEALTAADRPYKSGKTLSQALTIMARMRREQHIDPDLFELFLRSGVFRDYAQRFMRPEQIDEIDIEHYLGAPSPALAG